MRNAPPQRVVLLVTVITALYSCGGAPATDTRAEPEEKAIEESSPEDDAKAEPPADDCISNLDREELDSVSFWDAENGLASSWADKDEGAIYRVSKGGDTVRRIACLQAAWLDTAGTQDAWITQALDHGRLADLEPERTSPFGFFHSGDGGETWDRLPRPPVIRFSFASSEVGMGLGKGPRAFMTQDGGESWKEIKSPCVGELDGEYGKERFRGGFLSMVSETEAYAVCSGYLFEHPVYHAIFHTADGGVSWQEVPAESGGEDSEGCRLCTYGYLIGADFNGSGEGGLVDSDLGQLHKTTAGSPNMVLDRVSGRALRGGSVSGVQELDTGETIVNTKGPDAAWISADGTTWSLMFDWDSD
jgi:hypothetical protein